jgi:hypothetical protein
MSIRARVLRSNIQAYNEIIQSNIEHIPSNHVARSNAFKYRRARLAVVIALAFFFHK